MNGAVGVVQMIDGIGDAKWIITEALAGPYMAVVNTSLFDDVIELFMENPEKIAGVLVYDEKENSNRAMSFSQESQCPNEYASDPESQCSAKSVWNKKGTGLLRRDIPFPILFLSIEHNEEINQIEECYKRFNMYNTQTGPLCSIEISSFMFAAVDSELCMRRSMSTSFLTPTRICDPIGDYNVYYSLFPRVQKKEGAKESVTLVTARVDSASLFDGISPGASSSVVGLVTLVSTAAILSKMIPAADADKYDHNIIFTLFNGEAFDYIGSQRIAYDLSKGKWPAHAPLSPDDIKLHVEVGQIGGSLQNQDSVTPNAKWPMYAYTPNDPLHSSILEFTNGMTTNYNRFNESIVPKFTPNIPPSSIHSFRRILNRTETLPEIVLVDFEDEFTNMYYNSALDEYYQTGYEYRNISIDNNGTFKSTEELIASGVMNETDMQVKISRLSTALALTLYKRVVDAEYTGNLSASAHLVDEMLYCYTRSQACPLMQAVEYGYSDLDKLTATPPMMYAGVTKYSTNLATFAGHLLAILAGAEVEANETSCKKIEKPGYEYYWLMGWNHTGVCLQTTMNMSDAVSPAFTIEGYNLKSGLYSSWTESVWRKMSARMFVSATGAGVVSATIYGVSSVIVAIYLTYLMKRNKEIIFASAPATTNEASSGILRTVNC